MCNSDSSKLRNTYNYKQDNMNSRSKMDFVAIVSNINFNRDVKA